jgi:hypothetical protein
MSTPDNSSGKTTKKILGGLGALVGLAIAVYAGHELWPNDERQAAPDTPPPEYLYLDSDRVLAYLGQIEGGLTDSEKRTESETETLEAGLDPGLLADLKAKRERGRTVERVITPKATDRFFTLLVRLRAGRDREDESWLGEIDARLNDAADEDERNTVAEIQATIRKLEEGHFVRIENAQLFLAPYAAVVPRARYAAAYLGGEITEPKRPLYAPISRKEDEDLNAYLRNLGDDPTLPFVAPTLTESRESQSQVVTFLIPARYTALADNARLLAGNLTIVGKVIYKDPRLPGDETCRTKEGSGVPCRYFDRQTLTTYAPALLKARDSVLRNLSLTKKTIETKVRLSVSFEVPLMVVLSVAIYQ